MNAEKLFRIAAEKLLCEPKKNPLMAMAYKLGQESIGTPLASERVHDYAIAVSQALSREFGERFPEDKPHIAVLIEQTERILRHFD